MGYRLKAIVGPAAVLRTVARNHPGAVVVDLAQGFALVPLIGGAADVDLASWSRTGPVAHVEADFFGGQGSQRAVLWADGAPVFGPVVVAELEPFPPEGSPIAQVLRRLGVVRGPDDHDEFEAVGLHRHRHTEDWIR